MSRGRPRPSCGAAACIAHDGEPGGSDREHDAVAVVLIIGASRGIGLETVRAALEAGHSVRAMARSARRIPVDHPKLEKMAGDALEMATVKRALTGVDVVTQSLGVSAGPEIILKPTRFFSKATRVLVTAMEEAQVKRLICVTGFGAGDSRGRGGFLYSAAFHLLLGRVYDDKDVQERIVRRSKLDWVIVRPVILTDGPKTNAYRALVDPRGWTCGFISRADVADFLVKQIDDGTFRIRRRCSGADANAAAARPHPQADAAQTVLVTLGASDHQQDRCTVRHALRHHGRRPGRGDRDRKASNCRRVPARRHARTAAVIFSRLLQIIGAQCSRSSRCRKATGPVLNSCFSD